MSHRNVPWKPRSILKVPDSIRVKVATIKGGFVVGATIKSSIAAIAAGRYAHLNIAVEGDRVIAPTTVIPLADMGRWSETNINGRERVRKDLPMTQKSYSVESPNFGDWSKGSHTVRWERDVYVRDFLPAKQLAIRIEILDHQPDGDVTLSFRCEEVLEPGKPGFDFDLLYDLGLLQENTGHINVFPANASREDYLKTVAITWQILPPGTRDANIEKILGARRSASPDIRKNVEDRYDFLNTLRPTQYIAGTDGFRRYFGAQYGENLVVFENVEYGNAAYVMGSNWAALSKLSRLDLLAMEQRDFERVVHTDGWKKKLTKILQSRLKADK
jgi:hypothetical protein